MEEVITIADTTEFIENVTTVGETIKALNLTATNNNDLIEKLIKLLDVARTDAYKQGFVDAARMLTEQEQTDNGGYYN